MGRSPNPRQKAITTKESGFGVARVVPGILSGACHASDRGKEARAPQIPRAAGIFRRRVSSMSCLWVAFRSGCHARDYTRATTAHPMESRGNWSPVAISIPFEGVSLIPVVIFFANTRPRRTGQKPVKRATTIMYRGRLPCPRIAGCFFLRNSDAELTFAGVDVPWEV